MKKLKIDGDKLVLMAAIVAVFVLFTALNRNFLSVTNLINILIAASLVGLVAIGHTYLIIAGQNDLSPGSLAAFSGVLAATLVGMGVPFIVTCVITILAGMAVGLCNAFMVNKIKLEAFIATLVTQSVIRGFAYILCGGKPVAIANPTFLLDWKASYPEHPDFRMDHADLHHHLRYHPFENEVRPFHLRHRWFSGGSTSCGSESTEDRHEVLRYDGCTLCHRRYHLFGPYELRSAGGQRKPRV